MYLYIAYEKLKTIMLSQHLLYYPKIWESLIAFAIFLGTKSSESCTESRHDNFEILQSHLVSMAGDPSKTKLHSFHLNPSGG